MMMRVMLATALVLGLGAGVLAIWPEGEAERLASRAEFLAAIPRAVPAKLSACAPVRTIERHI